MASSQPSYTMAYLRGMLLFVAWTILRGSVATLVNDKDSPSPRFSRRELLQSEPESGSPTSYPSSMPTSAQPSISMSPTGFPTGKSSETSLQPSSSPAPSMSSEPTVSIAPTSTLAPSTNHSKAPTSAPSIINSTVVAENSTVYPTSQPSFQPSNVPSSQPTSQPTGMPTFQPTSSPTVPHFPTMVPTPFGEVNENWWYFLSAHCYIWDFHSYTGDAEYLSLEKLQSRIVEGLFSFILTDNMPYELRRGNTIDTTIVNDFSRHRRSLRDSPLRKLPWLADRDEGRRYHSLVETMSDSAPDIDDGEQHRVTSVLIQIWSNSEEAIMHFRDALVVAQEEPLWIIVPLHQEGFTGVDRADIFDISVSTTPVPPKAYDDNALSPVRIAWVIFGTILVFMAGSLLIGSCTSHFRRHPDVMEYLRECKASAQEKFNEASARYRESGFVSTAWSYIGPAIDSMGAWIAETFSTVRQEAYNIRRRSMNARGFSMASQEEDLDIDGVELSGSGHKVGFDLSSHEKDCQKFVDEKEAIGQFVGSKESWTNNQYANLNQESKEISQLDRQASSLQNVSRDSVHNPMMMPGHSGYTSVYPATNSGNMQIHALSPPPRSPTRNTTFHDSVGASGNRNAGVISPVSYNTSMYDSTSSLNSTPIGAPLRESQFGSPSPSNTTTPHTSHSLRNNIQTPLQQQMPSQEPLVFDSVDL